MNNSKPYAKYKPSGIAWLGNIPEHWEHSKLKYLTNKIVDGAHFTPTYVENGIPFLRVTDIQTKKLDLSKIKYIPKEEHDELIKRCNPQYGDILLSKNGTIGITKIVDWEFEFSIFVSLCLIKLKEELNPYFFSTLFGSKAVEVQIRESGQTTSVTNLHLEKIRELICVLPPLPEQTAIAAFLDYKTAKIDRFIRKKKQLIKLLNEQKAGIINDAVTKGLDTNAKMKPSGIEWLGDIPEHWEVRKLKYVADCFPSNIDKHTKEDEKKVRLCNYTDVYKNDFITNDMSLMVATATDEQIEKFRLQIGDVIITKDSETANDIAVPAYVKEELENVVCGYHLSVLRPFSNLDGEYLFRVLQCKPINIQFEVCSNGVTRVGLCVYDMKKAQIPIPPLPEQSAIVSLIEKETATINKTIATIEKEIALVQEYRTALIAEAVTGKIDVRGYEIPTTWDEEGVEEMEDEMSMEEDTLETQETA